MTSSSRRTPPPNRTRPARAARAARGAPRQSFLERNRTRLLWGLAGVALVAMASMAFLNATAPVYACTTQWVPAPTASPQPGATPRLGYVQSDFGREHEDIGSFVRYAICPPASGKHFNITGEGPVPPGHYGPDDQAVPQGWIHNLEHGGLVVLYRCGEGDSGCEDDTQAQLEDLYRTMPNSPMCNLPRERTTVIARFDQMEWPYAALLWGQVMPMDSLDGQLVRDFFAQQGEKTNPEPLCAKPTATPAPTGTPAPSGSPAPTATPAATPAATSTPAPSPTPAPTETPGAS